MNTVGQIEHLTQDCVIRPYCKDLGYAYMGNLDDSQDNSNIADAHLRTYFKRRRYKPKRRGAARHR